MEKDWVDYLAAFGSIATPIMVLILTGIGWKYRQSVERQIKNEERLQENRVAIYNAILEPFLMLLMPQAAWIANPQNKNKDKDQTATLKMLSLEYRNTASRLSLIGSDNVVRSFNELMQYFYNMSGQAQTPTNDDLKKMMGLLGDFLLAIRKSVGNESTTIDRWGMLEWFMTDARKMRDS